MPPTKEVIDNATLLVLSHEVARLDFLFWEILFETGSSESRKKCLKDMEKEKKKCMKKLKELFPNDIKQKGCFIDKVLHEHRHPPKVYNPFDDEYYEGTTV